MPHRQDTAKRSTVRLGCGAAAVLALIAAEPVMAAGTAYAVDTAEVGEVGNCKVEAWTSWARNGDRVTTASPACVVAAMPRLELSSEVTRGRADDEHFWALSPKLKVNLVPTAIGSIGWGFVAGSIYDGTVRDTTVLFSYVPATLRLSDKMRLNASGGWLLDRTTDRQFATYGIGLDWLFAPKFSLTLETFGQFNGDSSGPETRPRYQAGVRYRPVDNFSTDVIYGYNINGEGSHWITLSSTIRFSTP